jgi:hypothetical protein
VFDDFFLRFQLKYEDSKKVRFSLHRQACFAINSSLWDTFIYISGCNSSSFFYFHFYDRYNSSDLLAFTVSDSRMPSILCPNVTSHLGVYHWPTIFFVTLTPRHRYILSRLKQRFFFSQRYTFRSKNIIRRFAQNLKNRGQMLVSGRSVEYYNHTLQQNCNLCSTSCKKTIV